MSNIKALVTVALAALPGAAAAHGIGFHLGYGFWHDLVHLAPTIGGGLLAVALVAALRRRRAGTD